jgi:hypothetical protein
MANTSILPSVRVHAATSASVSPRLATRAALSANRGVVAQILAAHRPEQIVPMLLDRDIHCDVAVLGRVDVQWHAAVAGVTGPRRRLAGLEIGVQLRGQGRVGGFLHRHLDEAAPAGTLALEQRGEGGGIEVDPGNEIDDRRAGLDRRPVLKAGRRDQPRHRLDRQIHRQIVAVRPCQAVTRARGIDEARVYPVQYLPADAETVHDPGREILQHHVAALDHAEQQCSAALMLQVQSDRALVGVQHRDRKGRALAWRRPPTQRLALRRLDFDHVGPRLGHQQGRIRPLIDLAEIEHDDTGERPVGAGQHQRTFCARAIKGQLASAVAWVSTNRLLLTLRTARHIALNELKIQLPRS